MAKSVGAALSKIKSTTIGIGFSDLDMWVSSGNHAINYLNSGNFDQAFLFGRNYILFGESGCHARGTRVVMYDGTTTEIEKIRPGDEVMSPQGTPNRVLKAHKSTKPVQMYRIVPHSPNAKPYVINEDHILYLVKCDVNGVPVEQKNITLHDYMAICEHDPDFKDTWRMVRVFNQNLKSPDSQPLSPVFISMSGKKQRIGHAVPNWYYTNSNLSERMRFVSGFLNNFEESLRTNGEIVIDCGTPDNARQMRRVLEFAGYSVKQVQPAIISTGVLPNDNGYETYTFDVEPDNVDFFYGIQVDGNNLYLLEDWTVTHNSAKSLLCATTAANAQKEHDAYVVWIDVERATDDEAGKEWFKAAGLNIDEDNFLYLTASSLADIKKIILTIANDYRNEVNGGADPKELQPVVFVVDSWAAARTESQLERDSGKNAGDIVGDMGQKAKQLGDVITSITQQTSGVPILTIGVQHIMDSQEQYGRKHKTTGGHKLQYMASGSMILTKKEMRLEDVDDPSIISYYEELGESYTADLKKKLGGSRRVVGIVSRAEILKARTAKPFHSIDIQIPQKVGIDPYSGLFDLMMAEGMIFVSAQGWYAYQYRNENGDVEVVKFRKTEFRKNDHHLKIMELFRDGRLVTKDTSDDIAVVEDGGEQ